EADFLPNKLFLRAFNEEDKSSGYQWLDLESDKMTSITHDHFSFSSRVLKARDTEDILFTKENFETFPNLMHTDLNFEKRQQISDLNPQQKEYAWGSIELMEYTLKDGKKMQAMLAKPANFDPNKKYPLIVNFYEKSSNRLHSHRAPYPHRSTINYSYYTNRGYVILNPDVAYEVGYPGESALQAVMQSTDELLKKGFINEDNMALQGHSWGGYQIAHIVTKTDRFKCAESGAPVVNMTSAYGGIRWGSGRSRMFQYEHTQSRIGGTLWNNLDLYMENSPLFNIDKINTPVLILHNDKDGAVPWYQGIEFFVAMRRLEKPAWLLNYKNDPHWPLKRQNRKDFNIRMAQFFDHYLKDGPLPMWMEKGVPAIERGIELGY
ncbi:MAG: prolyl oligopeptidase family serine peptidase, partial [Bacteroidota bacterium]